MKKKLILLIISIILTTISVFVTFALNFGIITNYVVGDECKYDTRDIETSKLFDSFYTISSETGYHPEPSYFNFVFTFCIGLLIGISVSLLLYRKKWR